MNVLTYEQLKQRLDAVVAECAVVKSLNSKLCDELRGYETDNEDFGPAPQSLALAYSTETHAADAALAEVEAKAIEKFIVWATASSGFDYDLTIEDAQRFADELRGNHG